VRSIIAGALPAGIRRRAALTNARQWRLPPPEVVLAGPIHGLLRIGRRFAATTEIKGKT
jgi:hypothetical protein